MQNTDGIKKCFHKAKDSRLRHKMADLRNPLFCAECLPPVWAAAAAIVFGSLVKLKHSGRFLCGSSVKNKEEKYMKNSRAFTLIKWVCQAGPVLQPCRTDADNASDKGHLAAFTLIELLVVVLIIGILVAIAVPQYKVAVKKAKMTEYMTMVRAIVEAEEAYRLENGEYTDDLQALSISLPQKAGCEFTKDEWCSFYECAEEDVVYGVCDNVTNIQAGTKEATKYRLRYLEMLAPYSWSDASVSKGDRICQAVGTVENKVCQSFGPVERIRGRSVNGNAGWYRFL